MAASSSAVDQVAVGKTPRREDLAPLVDQGLDQGVGDALVLGLDVVDDALYFTSVLKPVIISAEVRRERPRPHRRFCDRRRGAVKVGAASPVASSPGMPPEPDDTPPFLGRWSRVYAVVVAWAVLVIAAIAVFSRWQF